MIDVHPITQLHQTITGSYGHSIKQVIWRESIKQLGYLNLNLKLMGGGGKSLNFLYIQIKPCELKCEINNDGK